LHEVTINFAAAPDGFAVKATDPPFTGTIGTGPGRTLVSGPARDLAAWLTGRGTGTTLAVADGGALPPVPRWK
jgi:maleylpyruvate isomerase